MASVVYEYLYMYISENLIKFKKSPNKSTLKLNKHYLFRIDAPVLNLLDVNFWRDRQRDSRALVSGYCNVADLEIFPSGVFDLRLLMEVLPIELWEVIFHYFGDRNDLLLRTARVCS